MREYRSLADLRGLTKREEVQETPELYEEKVPVLPFALGQRVSLPPRKGEEAQREGIIHAIYLCIDTTKDYVVVKVGEEELSKIGRPSWSFLKEGDDEDR